MSFRFTLVLAFVTLTLLSCRREDGDPVSPNSINTEMVKTAIAGNVVDASGEPIENVVIQVEGKSVRTTQFGTFFLEEVVVPKDRCTISCEKEGFFKGFKSSSPRENSITEFRVVLTGMKKHLFSSNEENTIKVGEAQIIFPANGYVYSDGTNYSGIVTAALGYLDPSTPNFYAQFSGDMAARRNDGSEAELYSFGVLRVELFDDNNKPLSLGNGKKASLYYPIDEFQKAHAPEKMPLWFFDETKKIWQEEGEVQKKGNMYIGSVSHFTSWNCDIPTQTAFLSGKVTCDELGVNGLEVRIGERTTITDENGNYRTRVPIGIVFPIEVLAERNDGIYSKSEQIGPFTVQSENNHDINLSVCPGIITGKVQCEGAPRGGTIIVEYPNGKTTSLFTLTGFFSGRIISKSDIRIYAFSLTGKKSVTKEFSKIQNTNLIDCGVFDICSNTYEQRVFWDFPIPPSLYQGFQAYYSALSPNGSKICVIESATSQLYIVDVEKGLILADLLIRMDTIGSFSDYYIEWSIDDKYILVRSFNDVYVLESSSGKIRFAKEQGFIESDVYFNKGTFSLNNTSIAFFNLKSTKIEVYDIATGQLIRSFDRPKHIEDDKTLFKFLNINDETTVVEYSYVSDRTVIIEEYDLISKKVLSKTKTSTLGYSSHYFAETFTFEGYKVCKLFLGEKGFFFYRLGNDTPIQFYKGVYNILARSDGKGLLLSGAKHIELLDFPSFNLMKTYPSPGGTAHDKLIRSFNDNRFALVYTVKDGTKRVRVWDS